MSHSPVKKLEQFGHLRTKTVDAMQALDALDSQAYASFGLGASPSPLPYNPCQSSGGSVLTFSRPSHDDMVDAS